MTSFACICGDQNVAIVPNLDALTLDIRVGRTTLWVEIPIQYRKKDCDYYDYN